MKFGERYAIKVKNQLVQGMFIREIKFLFFTWYEFEVGVHVRNFDYDKEYDTKEIYKIKKSNVLCKYNA